MLYNYILYPLMNYISQISNNLKSYKKYYKPKWINDIIFKNCIDNNIMFDITSKECGYGSYSRVFKVLFNNKDVSLKILNNKNNKKQIDNEIDTLINLSHKNIINYIHHFENNKTIYILTEYADCGELFYLINDNLNESECKYYITGIIDGLKYMHDNKFIHRDIKLENILVKNEKDIESGLLYKVPKLCDFGFSIKQENDKITGVLGTSQYIAPEILIDKSYDGFKSDIFSLGCLLYIMKYGSYPFIHRPDFVSNILPMNLEIYKIPVPEYPPSISISNELKNLIDNMIIIDPLKRYSLENVIDHKWFV
jgi:serine/threonine protein kinase